MLDVFLSLPIVSYFLAPTMTSWSTSLNLLFFYMTWSTLVLSHSPLKIELLGVLGLRLVLWLLPSLLFLAFDTLLPSLAESVKYNGASALPPRDPRQLARQLALALFNLALATAVEAAAALGLSALLRRPVFKTSTTLPLPWGMLQQLGLMLLLREVLTYYIHRYALHSSARRGGSNGRSGRKAADRSLSRLAKQHDAYAHARRAPPHALAVFADHPAPFVLHRVVPILAPALAVRPHLLTYFVFAGLATLEATLATSGYAAVPGVLMGGVARRTSIHYAAAGHRAGPGNFGAWGLLDWLHGTSVGGDVVADVRDEADKHRLQQRGQGKLNDAKGAVGDAAEGWKSGRLRSRGRKGE